MHASPPAPPGAEPPDAAHRSGPAIALLVAAAVLVSLAAIGGIVMLLTFAGICSPPDDCDSWRRRQAPIGVVVGVLGAVGSIVAGMVTVARGRARAVQVGCGLLALISALIALAFEVVYFTR